MTSPAPLAFAAETVRVAIADDDPAMRAFVRAALGVDACVSVVGEAENGQAALELVLDERPDVLVLDLSMPVLDGIEATRRLRALAPETRVVVHSSWSDAAHVLPALDAGAAGYQVKGCDPAELAAAVRAAARGESPLSPRVAVHLLRPAARTTRRPSRLTDRERAVLHLLSQGMTNAAIAACLGIADKTVKTHVTAIFRRIGVSDRTSAASWAREQGLAA